MGQKKMQVEEKACVLTLLEKGEYVIAVGKDIGASRKSIYQLRRLAASLPAGMVPKRKWGSNAPKRPHQERISF